MIRSQPCRYHLVCIQGPPVIPCVLIHFSSEGGFFKARLTFPPEFPLLPPKMRFITPMWHPNSAFSSYPAIIFLLKPTRYIVYADGVVCISILVSAAPNFSLEGCSLTDFTVLFIQARARRRSVWL